jgi:hypothetical protein
MPKPTVADFTLAFATRNLTENLNQSKSIIGVAETAGNHPEGR